VKIYTRTGDGGETSLMGAGRVPKDHLRVRAYGDVDEANAAVGLARTTAPRDLADDLLTAIQHDLFTIGGALATPEPDRVGAAQRVKVVVAAERISALEAAIDAADTELPALKAFVLPGGTPKAAALHLAAAEVAALPALDPSPAERELAVSMPQDAPRQISREPGTGRAPPSVRSLDS